MDTICEQLVKRKRSKKTLLLYAGVLLGAIVLVFAGFLIAMLTGFVILPYFVIVAVLAGGWWALTRCNLEFEYTVVSGEISIDKIINRHSRKAVLQLDVKEITAIGSYRADVLSGNYQKIYRVGIEEDGTDGWYAVFGEAGNGQNLLLFSPEEKTIDAIKDFLPYQVKRNAFGRS